MTHGVDDRPASVIRLCRGHRGWEGEVTGRSFISEQLGVLCEGLMELAWPARCVGCDLPGTLLCEDCEECATVYRRDDGVSLLRCTFWSRGLYGVPGRPNGRRPRCAGISLHRRPVRGVVHRHLGSHAGGL